MIDATLCAAIMFGIGHFSSEATIDDIRGGVSEATHYDRPTLVASSVAAILGNCSPPSYTPAQCTLLRQGAGHELTSRLPVAIPTRPSPQQEMNLRLHLAQMVGTCE